MAPKARRTTARSTPFATGPSDALSVRDGRLFVEERAAGDLVEEFGSPLFVFSERQLRSNLHRFQQAFSSEWFEGPVDILPAFKANTLLALRQILSEEGAGADVCTPEELEGVLRTPVDPARVSVSGGGKSLDHLRTCVRAGVRITVEEPSEVDRIQQVAAELDTVAKVRLRIKPAVPNLWRRTDFLQISMPIDLAYQAYKSGIPREYLADLGRRVFSLPNVELAGLHFHAGRHNPSLWFWEGLMTRVARLVGELSRAWDGWTPPELDIGGGMASRRDPHNKEFPRSEYLLTALGYPFMVGAHRLREQTYHALMSRVVPAFEGHKESPPPPAVEEYAATITATLRRELRRQGIDTAGMRLQVEPGRGLYGDTGVHLTRVMTVKQQTEPIPYTWVLTDSTWFFLAGGVMEHNRYPCLAADRVDAEPTMTADIVGQSSFADYIGLGERLPEVGPGDVIAVLEVGAYQESSTSNFNALRRPASVLVSGERASVVKRGDTVDDVYARDVVPARIPEQPAPRRRRVRAGR